MIRTVARLLLPDVIRRPIADRLYRIIAWCQRVRCHLGVRAAARFLLPGVIRRPIADMVYRLLAWCQNPPAGVSCRDSQWRGIPHRVFSKIVSTLHGAIRVGMASLWRKSSAYRYLLSANSRQLSIYEKAQKISLIVFFSLPDGYYRYKFFRFDDALKAGVEHGLFRQQRQGATLIIGTLGPGGAERQIMLTATGLARRAVPSLHVFCQSLVVDWQRFFLRDIESAGVPVAELEWADQKQENESPHSMQATIALNKLPASLAEVRKFLGALSANSPSVAHLWLDECNIKGGLAALIAGVPKIVLGLRSLPPCNFVIHQPYMREGYRYLARQPNVIMLNNSNSGARAYEKWLGLKAGSIRVIRNGFDFDPAMLTEYQNKRDAFLSSRGIPNDAPVVGTVIRLSEEKRPMLWLEIAALVLRQMPEVKFLMVGDGVMREAVEKRAAQEDLAGAVSLLGHQREPLAAIAAMDLFLLTSRLEGLPNVLIEAQALGVPVVTTDVGGAAETVSHGVTGWVLESDEAQYVANSIIKLLKDREWRSAASSEASSFVQKTFGVDRMLDETLDVYGLDPAGNIGGKINEKAK